MRAQKTCAAGNQGCRRNFLDDGGVTLRALLRHDRGGAFLWSLGWHQRLGMRPMGPKGQMGLMAYVTCVLCVPLVASSYCRCELFITCFDPQLAGATLGLPLFVN